jgi:phosphoglycolate phosphatase
MIGDTKLDLISAQNANVKSIGLTCGYGEEEELKKYTNIIKNSALQAVEYLKTIKK